MVGKVVAKEKMAIEGWQEREREREREREGGRGGDISMYILREVTK